MLEYLVSVGIGSTSELNSLSDGSVLSARFSRRATGAQNLEAVAPETVEGIHEIGGSGALAASPSLGMLNPRRRVV